MPGGQAQSHEVQHQQDQGAGEDLDGPEAVLQHGGDKNREDGDGDAPAEEHPADPVGVHAQDEGREGEDGEEAVVVEQAAGRRRPQPLVAQRQQRVPEPDLPLGQRGLGQQGDSAMKAEAISTAVPKNGARHCQPPSTAPSSGPREMPRPRAAS